MHPAVRELETLRRELESARSKAGSIDDAIDKGWIGKGDQERLRAEMRNSLEQVGALEPRLKELVKNHKRQDTGAIAEWVALHLKVCQKLLRAGASSRTQRAGVREVCIGNLLSELGGVLGPQAFTFSVNSYYLADYDAEFDQLAEKQKA